MVIIASPGRGQSPALGEKLSSSNIYQLAISGKRPPASGLGSLPHAGNPLTYEALCGSFVSRRENLEN